MLSAPTPTSPPLPPTRRRRAAPRPVHRGGVPVPVQRIAGIDIARGIALLGMVAVHVAIFGPEGEEPGAVTSAVLEAPSGQASVLFFLLSGVSLSVIARRRSSSATTRVLLRRGAVLIIGGLLLTSTIWGASILEHYGVMFLLAPFLLRRSNRTLLAVSAAGLLVGPIGLLALIQRTDFLLDWPTRSVTVVIETVTGLLVDGIYPLIVWTGFFTLGMVIGRLDLRSRRVAARLFGAGVVSALLVTGVVTGLSAGGLVTYEEPVFDEAKFDEAKSDEAKFDEATFDEATFDEAEFDEAEFGDDEFADVDFPVERDPSSLISTQGHSGAIGWTLRASAIAVAILGAALLLPSMVQRALFPLSALGSISLTAYLLHIFLVTDLWSLVVGDEEPKVSIGWQILTLLGIQAGLLLIASIIVARWKTGPAERGLKSLTTR